MRLHFATKNLSFAIAFRETGEDEEEEVSNIGGSFEPADEGEDVEELRSTEFGFHPAVKRA